MEIQDKIIIVTGASQGIGRATAKYLTAHGAKVVLASRTEATLKALEKELPGSYAVPTDMRKTEDVKRLIDATVKKFGRVDILINDAGEGMWIPVEQIDIEKYKEMMDLNVYGYLRAMQAVVPVMRTQGGGMIVNISSMVTKMTYPDVYPALASYTSTKFAVNALSYAARKELEKDKIVVCIIMPKLVETQFGKHALVPEPDALRDRNNKQAPPMDTPEDVAEKIGELIKSEAPELGM